MNNKDNPSTTNAEQVSPNVHDAIVSPKSRISKIWLVPFVALIVGLGMVIDHINNKGTNIEIKFNTAEGLIAGKTVLKNRNVDIGLVKNISFNEDKSKILVVAEIEKGMESFLVQDSTFWVVRPRIGAQGISGIDTLLSGPYIEVSAGESTIEENRFVGLESPPISPSNADGIHLKLISKGTKAHDIGTPILHKGFKVGAVENKYYDDLEQEAHYDIFVSAPFHNLVTENTSFWDASGITFKADAKGVSFEFASVETLISGGIKFDLLNGSPPGLGVPHNHPFTIYDSKESVAQDRIYQFIEYVILVEDSVSGLEKGAPVDYRGIRIGTVHEPFMAFERIREISGSIDENRIPVIVRLEPERLTDDGSLSISMFEAMMEHWIEDGLTATISNESLITGTLKVSLSPDGAAQSKIDNFGDYPIIPFKAGAIGTLAESMENVLSKISALELERTISNVNDLIDTGEITLKTADQTMKSADLAMQKAIVTAGSLENTLSELETTLQGLQPNSELYKAVSSSINSIESTLEEIKPLVVDVTNKPNSLIFAGEQAQDQEPSKKQKDTNP